MKTSICWLEISVRFIKTEVLRFFSLTAFLYILDGSDYSKIGLKSSTIASSFGKVFRKGQVRRDFKPEDIARSLLYAISNNIGQIAYVIFLFI